VGDKIFDVFDNILGTIIPFYHLNIMSKNYQVIELIFV